MGNASDCVILESVGAITRRNFLGTAATGVGGLWLGDAWPMPANTAAAAGSFESFYKAFADPDRKYSIRPSGDLLSLHLAVPEPEWWNTACTEHMRTIGMGSGLRISPKIGGAPSVPRAYWMPGANKSRVVAANAEYHIRVLDPKETLVTGPKRVEVSPPSGNPRAVSVGLSGPGRLDGETLRTLHPGVNSTRDLADPGYFPLAWIRSTRPFTMPSSAQPGFRREPST